MRPGQKFMPCESWQYNSGAEIARLFHMRIDFAGFLPMVGRDSYVRGQGRMHGKLLGLVTVADGHGPETDTSELTTYLNDAVMMAPLMLLRPEVQWSAVDDDSFDIALTDAGVTVTARVFLDEHGAPATSARTTGTPTSRAGRCGRGGRHRSRAGRTPTGGGADARVSRVAPPRRTVDIRRVHVRRRTRRVSEGTAP